MSSAAHWEVTAVRYGTLASTRERLFYRWDAYGDADGPQSLDYFFYVLRGSAGRTLLVDCGFEPEAGERRGRQCLISPLDALSRLGVRPADVQRVIVSHMHYDHIGNLDAFPNADLVVPAGELAFWTSALAREPHFWVHVDVHDVEHVLDARAKGRIREIAGRTMVEPGVEAIEVGGHSPGQQMLVVDTASGPVLLATDAIHLYEEVERRRPFGVIVDLERMYHAYDLAERLASDHGAVLVAGHDPLVKERFPDAGGTAAGIAWRIA